MHASTSRRTQGVWLSNACDQCYRRKQACTKSKPTCGRCHIDGRHCTYSQGRGSGRPRKLSRSTTTESTPSAQTESMNPCNESIEPDVNVPNVTSYPSSLSSAQTYDQRSSLARHEPLLPGYQSFWPDLDFLKIPGLGGKSTTTSNTEDVDQEAHVSLMDGTDDAIRSFSTVSAMVSPSVPLYLGEAETRSDKQHQCRCVGELLHVMPRAWALFLQPPPRVDQSVASTSPKSGSEQMHLVVNACERLIMCDEPHSSSIYALLLLLSSFQGIDDYLNTLTSSEAAEQLAIHRKGILRAIMVLSALDIPGQFNSWGIAGAPEQMEYLQGFTKQLLQRLRNRLMFFS